MRARVCVCLLSGFYHLVSNVSDVTQDPLIMLLSPLFSGTIKDTSGYQEAALGDWQALNTPFGLTLNDLQVRRALHMAWGFRTITVG